VAGLNAAAAGISGKRSRLIYDAMSKIKMIEDFFGKGRVDILLENVASMDSSGPRARQEFSRVMRVEPFRLCASELGWVRRPRFYWITWKLAKDPLLQVEDKEGYAHGGGLNGLRGLMGLKGLMYRRV
jgi:hypothetical protein